MGKATIYRRWRSKEALVADLLDELASPHIAVPDTGDTREDVQGNGEKARTVFSAFAALRDPELGRWVHDAVAFPSSMVDRITPVTTDEDRALVRERLGVEDRWPVVAEPFFQWVLEDRFPLGRPPLETPASSSCRTWSRTS